MKPNNEFVGKNVKTAVEKASEELQIPKDDIKYDVISNGSSGIFGLVGVKKAKIRVILTETEPRINNNLEFTSSAFNTFGNSSVKSLVDEAFNGTEKRVPKTTNTDLNIPVRSNDPTIDLSSKQIQIGKDVLQKIIDLITSDATISVEVDCGCAIYNVIGGNAGVLIGKRGQNLEAIQYLIDKIVNKNSEKRIRLQVDVEGYLKNRKENLIKLAERLAEKTKRTGRPSTIGQISAQDRRTVHLTLKSDKQVRTQSIGDGYYRKLVIFPKKNSYKRKPFKEKVSSGK